VDAVDTVRGGGPHDLSREETQEALLRAVERQRYQLVWLGIPCASFSVLWTQALRPTLRDRLYPSGRPDLPPTWQRYVMQHNALAGFSAAIALLAWEASATFVIENPVDRGLRRSPHFRWAWRNHAPLWLLPSIRALASVVQPRWITFAQCAWSSDFQKWTTLMVGGRHARHLDVFNDMPCRHSRHARVARGYDGDGASNAVPAGEYPTLMCAAVAAAISTVEPIPRAQWLEWRHRSRFSAEARALAQWASRQAEANALAAAAFWDEEATTPAPDGAGVNPASASDVQGLIWRSAPDAIPAAWPERLDVAGERARAARTAALRYVSRRRAEPESSRVLSSEELPVPHPPPSTVAAPDPSQVPWPKGAPARPVRIEQLYNPGVYIAIRRFIQVIASDLRAAEDAARAGRPIPPLPFRDTLECPAASTQPAWARECVWDTSNPHDCVPLQPYSEVERPVQDVDWRFFAHWGALLRWPDADMLRRVAVVGCDSRSTCPRNTVIFGHHGGLRTHYEPAKAVVDEDTAQGWVTLGTADLHTVPQRLVPRNVVSQRKWKIAGGELVEVTKWRVATDDSMDAPLSASRNAGIDSTDISHIQLPTLRELGRAVAVLQSLSPSLEMHFSPSALQHVALWALDLSSAYRKLAAARHERWLQGFIWYDGVRTDSRCEFGSAHLVDLFERVSSFVLAVARRRIRQYDRLHPYTAARAAWCADRRGQGLTSTDPTYSAIYLDDGFGATCLEPGEPMHGKPPGRPPVDVTVMWRAASQRLQLRLFVHSSRAQMHLAIVRQTFNEAGWDVAVEKVQLGPCIDLLGLALDTRQGGFFFVPEAKRRGLLAELAAQQPPLLHSDNRVPRTAVERLVGRLGHIAQVVAEGNAHMQPLFRLQNASFRVRLRGAKRDRGGAESRARPGYRRVRPRHIQVDGSTAALRQYQHALSWWSNVLEGHVTVPLAPRLVFPDVSAPGCAFVFTDAAREIGTGHGGFTCVRWAHEHTARFYYMSRRWPDDVRRRLQADKFSMPAGEVSIKNLTRAVAHASASSSTLPHILSRLDCSDNDAFRNHPNQQCFLCCASC